MATRWRNWDVKTGTSSRLTRTWGRSSKSVVFGKEFPDRYFNVRIAEANMVAMAAGLAAAGKIPFANTFAAFMVLRAVMGAQPDRLHQAECQAGRHLCRAVDSYDGASHHSITDIAFMRSLPNMTVISVSDPFRPNWLRARRRSSKARFICV